MLSVLKDKVQNQAAVVSVIGLGYVGLPLALDVANAGFSVYGIDVDQDKIAGLKEGRSHIIDVSDDDVKKTLASDGFMPTTNFDKLAESDVVVICVPTPLRKSKDPDISYILSAMDEVVKRLHKGMLIVLESTTYPGTTDELISFRVAEKGMVVGEDIFVCFSPERVDPGNRHFRTKNTPRLVGGVTPFCAEIGTKFYLNVIEDVVPVSSTRVAETAKLLENTFRSVNIALVNEMALMCERMGIDIWEVIEAAATKPYGFMPFYPGPGLGGHCIPLDPMYLSWKAKSYGFHNKFIELASDINGNMPRHVVDKVGEVLNLEGKALYGAKILVLGMAYKRDVGDVRESPSLEIYKLLRKRGAQLEYYDPYVSSFAEGSNEYKSSPTAMSSLAAFDCVVLATDHTEFDYEGIARHARLILDTRNGFKNNSSPHIIRLGEPTPSVEQWRQITAGIVEAAAMLQG